MLYWSGLGWMLIAVWLLSILIGTEIFVPSFGMSLTLVFWIATGTVSLVGWILGRSDKNKERIYWKFNASKSILVSRHRFMFLPAEHWVWFAPLVHILAYVIIRLLLYFDIA